MKTAISIDRPRAITVKPVSPRSSIGDNINLFRFEQRGILLTRLEIGYASGTSILGETYAYAIPWAVVKAAQEGTDIARVPATLLRVDSPAVEMEPQDKYDIQEGVPGWIKIPLSLLIEPYEHGPSVMERLSLLCRARGAKLEDESDSSGGYYYGTFAPISKEGALVLFLSQINIADMTSQRPSQRLAVFDPAWHIQYLSIGGSNSYARNVNAGEYFRETLRIAREVRQEVGEIFRTMNREKPKVSDALRAKLDRLGGGLPSWDKGALEGIPNCMDQFRGRSDCNVQVQIPLREVVDYDVSRGEIERPPVRRMRAGHYTVPLSVAEQIALEATKAGWK